MGESLRVIAMYFVWNDSLVLLLKNISGSEKLLKRAFIQNWSVLCHCRLLLHVDRDSENSRSMDRVALL